MQSDKDQMISEGNCGVLNFPKFRFFFGNFKTPKFPSGVIHPLVCTANYVSFNYVLPKMIGVDAP